MPGRLPCPDGCGCGVHFKGGCVVGCGCGRHVRSALHNELIGRGVRRALRERKWKV